MIQSIRYAGAGVVLAVLVLTGCASTSLTGQWQSPGFGGPPLARLMIVGVANEAGPRRIFEDEFVAALKQAGVAAVPSYTAIPQNGQADEALLEKAVREAGADGVLITRLVETKREQRVVPPRHYSTGYAPGVYGWYGRAWRGVYEPPQVYEYDIVTAETSVYSLAHDGLLWSATTETFDPRNLAQEMPAFAKTIIDALKKAGII